MWAHIICSSFGFLPHTSIYVQLQSLVMFTYPQARCYRKNEYDGVQEYWIVWRERGSHEEMKEVTEKQRSRQEAAINYMSLQWFASTSSNYLYHILISRKCESNRMF